MNQRGGGIVSGLANQVLGSPLPTAEEESPLGGRHLRIKSLPSFRFPFQRERNHVQKIPMVGFNGSVLKGEDPLWNPGNVLR